MHQLPREKGLPAMIPTVCNGQARRAGCHAGHATAALDTASIGSRSQISTAQQKFAAQQKTGAYLSSDHIGCWGLAGPASFGSVCMIHWAV